MSKAKKKTDEPDDIVRDHGLMSQINTHITVYGFTSAVDNLVAACEDKVDKWKERLEKAKKLRKSLGSDWGRN